MTPGKWLKGHNVTAPAVLLFTALLAQAPHAAAVFIRIAPHGAQWEVWTSFVGAWVYAIALEGATAYFVWKNRLAWAIGFALFSVAHNVAYYMPATWTFTLWGATLTVRDTFSAILISVSLPVAIAAFSHVQAMARHDNEVSTDETQDDTAPTTDVAPATEMQPAAETQPATVQTVTTAPQLVASAAPTVKPLNKTQLAVQLGVSRTTISNWTRDGKLDDELAKRLPDLAPIHTNGNSKQAQL